MNELMPEPYRSYTSHFKVKGNVYKQKQSALSVSISLRANAESKAKKTNKPKTQNPDVREIL